jgi:hypothetical protein
VSSVEARWRHGRDTSANIGTMAIEGFYLSGGHTKQIHVGVIGIHPFPLKIGIHVHVFLLEAEVAKKLEKIYHNGGTCHSKRFLELRGEI